MKPAFLHTRVAAHADLPGLLDLYRHLNPEDDSPGIDMAGRVLDRFMAYEGSAIFIGEADGALVASCALVVVPNLTRGGRSYGLIENVVTHRDFRKRGFGRQILAAASAAAWKAGCYQGDADDGFAPARDPELLSRRGVRAVKDRLPEARPGPPSGT